MSRLYSVGPARPEEVSPALRLMFQHLPDAQAGGRTLHALNLVARGELSPDGILVARSTAGLLGAVVCVVFPGASALVWPPQAQAGDEAREIEDSLVQGALDWLQGRGVKLAQSLLHTDEAALGAPLERNGFAHVTSLLYLRHLLQLSGSASSAQRLTFQVYSSENAQVFQNTLQRTYEGTLDCPELNGVRNLAEIMEGHKAQGHFDAHLWRLALEDARPVGVLLLTTLPDWHGADISYLGLVPEARGRGLGRELAQLAIETAKSLYMAQLTLAVDIRNRPATALYTGLGFESFDSREVYLAFLPDAGPRHRK